MKHTVDAIIAYINQILRKRGRAIIAIDGRCASGKSTLAAALAESVDATVFKMDDFFLRPQQRTTSRLVTPGENVDHERFLREILLPVSENQKEITYKAFDCKNLALSESVKIIPKDIVIIEGSYSCHKSLWDYYDLRVFLTVSEQMQIKRIISRNGELKAEIFKSKWIPFEEEYFNAFDIQNRCDICINTDEWF